MRIFNYESGKEQGIRAEMAFVESIVYFEPVQPFCQLKITRDRIVHDSLLQLAAQKSNLKKKLRVEFTDESGLDAGGLAKEWMLLLVRELFDPIQGLFCYEEEGNFLWFYPTTDYKNKLEVYELCGIIIGLAMYNGILLDLALPLVCYKKLLGIPGELEDLKEFRPDVYKNLHHILNYNNRNDFEDTFSLSFLHYDRDLQIEIDLAKISENDHFINQSDKGDRTSKQIFKSNNRNHDVKFEDRIYYVGCYVNYILNKRIEPIFDKFKSGFSTVCNCDSLYLFRPYEIEAIVNGSKEKQIDVTLIRENSIYSSGFSRNDPIVLQFWQIFQNYDDIHKRKLLRFITGSDRLPCVGNPSDFGIHLSCISEEDSDRYPIAHTCFNQLCLYRYSSQQKLYEKLTSAVDECSGFDLR